MQKEKVKRRSRYFVKQSDIDRKFYRCEGLFGRNFNEMSLFLMSAFTTHGHLTRSYDTWQCCNTLSSSQGNFEIRTSKKPRKMNTNHTVQWYTVLIGVVVILIVCSRCIIQCEYQYFDGSYQIISIKRYIPGQSYPGSQYTAMQMACKCCVRVLRRVLPSN